MANKITIKEMEDKNEEFKLGDLVNIEGGIYIIAHITSNEYQLTNLEDGVRWTFPQNLELINKEIKSNNGVKISSDVIISPGAKNDN